MATGSFQVGQRFLLAEEKCRIMRSVGTDQWAVENMSNGRIWETSTSDLLSKWERAELQFPGAPGKTIPSTGQQTAFKNAAVDAFMQSYPEAVLLRAKAKLAFVKRLWHVPITACTIVPLIQKIWSDKALWKGACVFEKPPHYTTVASWMRAYREAGEDIRALADRHHSKGNCDPRYEDDVEKLADDVIETMYLVLERPSIASCLGTLRGHVARLNQTRLPSEQLAMPTYAYLKRKIAQLPAYDVCLARYGKQIADIRFRAAGNGAFAEGPLARAAIDHCRLDVIVVDDATGLPLGRPWLTLILDEFSRYVLGYYIGFEEPSNVSVSRAIRNALMPKTGILQRYPEMQNRWDAWGVIHTLVADNGLEFHGNALDSGSGTLGMDIQFCPRRKPWYKGKIERFFRTISSGLLATIPGKTFSNVLDKGDYNPLKHAVVGLETLREIVLIWIVDVYHQSPHRGLGKRTPASVWDEAIAHTDRWLPSASTLLDSAFSRSETRSLTHKGIEYDSLFYNSNDLRVLREQYGETLPVEVRVMDDDLGHLFVVSPDGHTVIKVPALDEQYAKGMTRWQHMVCRRYQRRMQDDQAQVISLLDAKERIKKLVYDDATRRKPNTRKRQARFCEQADGQLHISGRGSHEDHAHRGANPPGGSLVEAKIESVSPPSSDSHQDEVPVLPSRRVHRQREASYEH